MFGIMRWVTAFGFVCNLVKKEKEITALIYQNKYSHHQIFEAEGQLMG